MLPSTEELPSSDSGIERRRASVPAIARIGRAVPLIADQCPVPLGCQLTKLFRSRPARRNFTISMARWLPTSATRFRQAGVSASMAIWSSVSPKDIGRLVALPRAKPKPSANGLVADASPFRGWWLATGMAGAVAALVILASFGASIGWRWPDYYEPAFNVSNPTPQEVSIPASAAPVVDAPPSLDAPAPPLDNPAPQEIPAQPASPAPQEVTTPLELPAIVPPGPHLHAGTNGGWEPDAGCKWASNDTRDVTVVCE